MPISRWIVGYGHGRRLRWRTFAGDKRRAAELFADAKRAGGLRIVGPVPMHDGKVGGRG